MTVKEMVKERERMCKTFVDNKDCEGCPILEKFEYIPGCLCVQCLYEQIDRESILLFVADKVEEWSKQNPPTE